MNPLRSRIPSENQTCLPQDIDSCWIHEYSINPLRRLVFAHSLLFCGFWGVARRVGRHRANVASSSSSVESGTELVRANPISIQSEEIGLLIQIDPSPTETD